MQKYKINSLNKYTFSTTLPASESKKSDYPNLKLHYISQLILEGYS